MSITFTLVEGKDYTFEADGRAPALTATGFERMLEAHAAGRDVAIEIDQIVVFRLQHGGVDRPSQRLGQVCNFEVPDS